MARVLEYLLILLYVSVSCLVVLRRPNLPVALMSPIFWVFVLGSTCVQCTFYLHPLISLDYESIVDDSMISD